MKSKLPKKRRPKKPRRKPPKGRPKKPKRKKPPRRNPLRERPNRKKQPGKRKISKAEIIQRGNSGEYGSSDDVREGYFGGHRVKYCVIDGLAIYQGDIVLGTVEDMEAYRLAIETPSSSGYYPAIRTLAPGARWPNGIVPYSIEDVIVDKTRITGAMAYFRPNTNIQFVERTSEANFVFFHNAPADKCSSDIGMQTGQTTIRIGRDCSKGSIAHEICHALGLRHEHARSDRDSFVTIHWENIKGTTNQGTGNRDTPPADNFAITSDPSEDFGAYDYNSIMHYSKTAFTRNGLPTISPRPHPTQAIGQRDSLGAGDLAVLSEMYPAAPTAVGESSDTGPAITVKYEKLLLAWKGQGNDDLGTIPSRDGIDFSGKVTLGERSTNAPALAVHGDRYVLAWTGVGNDRLNVMLSGDGAAWVDKVTLDDISPSAPALAAAGPDIFLAWRGGDDRLNLTRSLDGRFWWPKITLSERTNTGPALCVLGPNLLLASRGRGNDNLNIMPFALALIGGPKVTLSDRTVDRPALCSTGNRAFLSWPGEGNGFVNVMASGDGSSWTNKLVAPERCLGGPAVTTFGGRLVRAWTDDSPGNSLRTLAFDSP